MCFFPLESYESYRRYIFHTLTSFFLLRFLAFLGAHVGGWAEGEWVWLVAPQIVWCLFLSSGTFHLPINQNVYNCHKFIIILTMHFVLNNGQLAEHVLCWPKCLQLTTSRNPTEAY